MRMLKINSYYRKSQVAKIKKLSKETEISVAEHLRSALDDYLEKEEIKIQEGACRK